MLRGEYIWEFDGLVSQKSGTINSHLKHIQEVLLGYLPPINTLYNQKRAMRLTIHKPWNPSFNRFSACLTYINNYLPILPGSSEPKKMPPKELNGILLHAVPNGWSNEDYLQGWEFEGKSYKEIWEFFERMGTT